MARPSIVMEGSFNPFAVAYSKSKSFKTFQLP
jgi:hypothetical protein